MGMSRKDYQLIAEALKVTGETDMEVWSAEEPGATWWRMLNELSSRFSEDNPQFNETIFQMAAIPKQEARS